MLVAALRLFDWQRTVCGFAGSFRELFVPPQACFRCSVQCTRQSASARPTMPIFVFFLPARAAFMRIPSAVLDEVPHSDTGIVRSVRLGMLLLLLCVTCIALALELTFSPADHTCAFVGTVGISACQQCAVSAACGTQVCSVTVLCLQTNYFGFCGTTCEGARVEQSQLFISLLQLVQRPRAAFATAATAIRASAAQELALAQAG